MHRTVLNSGGLGITVPTLNTVAELIPYCSQGWLEYLTASGCWNYSYDAWQQMAALPTIPVPTAAPAAPSTALTDPNAVLADTSGDTSQELSNAAIAEEQNDLQSFIDSLSDNPVPAAPCSFLNIDCGTLAIAAAIGVAALYAWKVL